MSKPDGGPAFPQADKWNEDGTKVLFQPPDTGMTLRDYFAAKSMQAYRATFANHESKMVAEWAYEDADAMLSERGKK